MKSPYLLEEQETTINVFPAAMSDKAEVYTCIPNMIDRIIKLHEEYPEEVSLTICDGYINASVPRSWVKIQPKRKCSMTEEQRKATAERLAAYRAMKKEEHSDDAT